MPPIQDHQYTGILRVAREQLAYCQYIQSYPKKAGKLNFDVSNKIDQFYKSINNACFHDSLLLVGNLLDKDLRVISFWNWPDFVAKKEAKLQVLADRFKSDGLKIIRDQIVAHIDAKNRNNNFPDSRRSGMINKIYVDKLVNLLGDLIDEFKDYTRKYATPYADQVFSPIPATSEIEAVMELAKPQMTDNIVL